jgi:hypothetical protein
MSTERSGTIRRWPAEPPCSSGSPSGGRRCRRPGAGRPAHGRSAAGAGSGRWSARRRGGRSAHRSHAKRPTRRRVRVKDLVEARRSERASRGAGAAEAVDCPRRTEPGGHSYDFGSDAGGRRRLATQRRGVGDCPRRGLSVLNVCSRRKPSQSSEGARSGGRLEEIARLNLRTSKTSNDGVEGESLRASQRRARSMEHRIRKRGGSVPRA